MSTPQLFPNQPHPDDHVKKHSDKETGHQVNAVKLNDVATRLKILEERYSTLRKKSLLTEQNIIESDKDHFQEIHLLSEKILDVKRILRDLAEKVSLLSDEVQNFVNINEFKVLKRYIDFWQPMDFVTRKEVNNFLRKKFKELKEEKTKVQQLKQ